MAAAAISGVIGVVSGVLGIVQFGMDNFATPDAVGSVINIAVGLDYTDGLNNAGGDLPDVRLFNEGGEFLGMKIDAGGVSDGSAAEIKVPYYDQLRGQQAAYGLFSANNDAICIAYLTITWPDGNTYGFDGNWGGECDGSWYFSNVFIKGSGMKPNCFWIDGNGDTPETGFQLHFPEFVTDDAEPPADKNVDYYCKSGPPFKLFTEDDPSWITYWTLPTEKAKRSSATANYASKSEHPRQLRNKNTRRQGHINPHLDKLIIANSTEHQAHSLCDSKTSVGPDFVNLEGGNFCRMSDKTLWPICTIAITDNCFNLDVQQLIVGGLATRNTPYIDVGDWTSG